MPIIDTFFDPFQQVLRKAGFSAAKMIYGNKREALHMLSAVTETVCAYMYELRQAGCDAVLYSINGAIAPPGDRGIDDATTAARWSIRSNMSRINPPNQHLALIRRAR